MIQKPETIMSTMSKCTKSLNFICIAALMLLGSAFASELTIEPEVQLGLELIFLNGSAIGGMGMGMGIGSSEAVESLMSAGRKGSGCNKGKGASVASVKSEASNGMASGVGTGKSCPFSKNRGMGLGQRSSNSYSQDGEKIGRASEYLAASQRRARRSANLQRKAQLRTEGEFENEPLSQKARIQSYSSSTKGSSKRTKNSDTDDSDEANYSNRIDDSEEANHSNRTDDSEEANHSNSSINSESTESMSNSSSNSESTDSADQSTESSHSDYICKCKGK